MASWHCTATASGATCFDINHSGLSAASQNQRVKLAVNALPVFGAQ